MHRYLDRGKGREGAAICTVLVVIFMVCALLGTLMASSVQRSFMAGKLSNRAKALGIAEAGANHAYSVLVTNFEARMSDVAFPLTAYGDGTFDVGVLPVSNNVAIITSTGICGDATEVVMLDCKNYGDDFDTELASLDSEYAVLCGGTFNFRGCGDISSTNGSPLLHSNGGISIRGNCNSGLSISSSTEIKISNNVTVDGVVTAPTVTYNASKVTITGGANEEPVPLVDIPDIDLTPYYNWANDHGEVRNGFSMSGGTYTPSGGILWVNGDVHISSHTVFNGSIIATGKITMSGASEVHPSDCGFGLVSRDQDIENTSSGLIEGVIYAKSGNYKQTANGRHEGQLIVKGNIDKGGNSDVLVFVQNVVTPPGDDSGNDDLIGVSAWQK